MERWATTTLRGRHRRNMRLIKLAIKMPVGWAPFVRPMNRFVSARGVSTNIRRANTDDNRSTVLICARADSICTAKRSKRIVHACGCSRLSRINPMICVLAMLVAILSCPRLWLLFRCYDRY